MVLTEQHCGRWLNNGRLIARQHGGAGAVAPHTVPCIDGNYDNLFAILPVRMRRSSFAMTGG